MSRSFVITEHAFQNLYLAPQKKDKINNSQHVHLTMFKTLVYLRKKEDINISCQEVREYLKLNINIKIMSCA